MRFETALGKEGSMASEVNRSTADVRPRSSSTIRASPASRRERQLPFWSRSRPPARTAIRQVTITVKTASSCRSTGSNGRDCSAPDGQQSSLSRRDLTESPAIAKFDTINPSSPPDGKLQRHKSSCFRFRTVKTPHPFEPTATQHGNTHGRSTSRGRLNKPRISAPRALSVVGRRWTAICG
jgi:hypothetical protein